MSENWIELYNEKGKGYVYRFRWPFAGIFPYFLYGVIILSFIGTLFSNIIKSNCRVIILEQITNNIARVN